MPYAKVEFPPGVRRNGTQYENMGSWWDAYLVRWRDGAMQPVGGWRKLQVGGADLDIGAPIKAMHVWRDNAGKARLGFGSHDKLFAFSEGVQSDITPAGFTGGAQDASLATGGYGAGNYGDGLYGEGDTSQTTVVPAQTWSLDNFGERFIACARSDGLIYEWDLIAAQATVVDATAPIDNLACVVTPENFLVALGADGDPRSVHWADQGSLTDWDIASVTNTAGQAPLQGAGEILAGMRSRNETLIWTTVGLWSMKFVGGVIVYGFQKVGSNCGAIAPNAMTVVNGGIAYWMGQNGFWVYDGQSRPIPSDVSDYVFSDINRLQVSKIKCVPRSEFHEIRWHYCSAGSTDIDRSVSLNTLDGTWNINPGPARTAGVDRGVFDYALMGDRLGRVYEHEVGVSYLDLDDVTELNAYAESGPMEIGEGDRTMMVRQIVPDENTLGDVEMRLKTRLYPTATETTHGPFVPREPTDVRVTARQIRVRLDQVNPNWRFGTQRLEITPGSFR